MSRISPIKLLVCIAIAVCAFWGWGIYWFSQQFPLGEKVPRLLQAAREGNLHDINLFLLQGDDINVVDDNKRNALWWALVFEQYKAARLLLDRGINVNSRSNNGLTVLEYCKTSRLTEQFEWLSKEIRKRGHAKINLDSTLDWRYLQKWRPSCCSLGAFDESVGVAEVILNL